MQFKAGLALSLILAMALFSLLPVNYAEAKRFYGADLQYTFGVFLMISIAIGGFGILLALYARESLAIKQN